MGPQDRKKMCVQCDGRIPLEAESCPYCGTQSSAAAPTTFQHHQSLQESLTSLYPPPYTAKKSEPVKAPMPEKRINQSLSLGSPTIPQDVQEEQAEEATSSFWPIFLLSIAANLLTVGLLQLFFSDDGFLRLEWNSSYWFVYCLAAAPLLFFGFRKANQLS